MSIKIIVTGAVLVATATTAFAGSASAAPARGTTHVHVTKKHTVVVPATLRPGVVHLHNDGSRAIVVIRKKHDGIDKLVRYANSKSGADGKKLFSHFTIVAALDKHADAYTRLGRGTYFVLDGGADKLKAAKIRTVTVRGATSNAIRPASTRNLTVGRSGTLTGATTGTRHEYLRLRNTTGQIQLLSVLRIPTKTTDAEFADLVAHPTGDKLEKLLENESSFASDLFAFPHQDVTEQSNLKAGRYLVLTFGAIFSNKPKASQVHALTLR